MPDQIEQQEEETIIPDRELQIEKNGKWQPLVDHCFDLYTRIRDSEYRKKKIQSIKRSCEVYAQEEQKGINFPWNDAFKMILPLYTITNDNLEPRIVASLVGKDPYVKFDMEGMNKQDQQTEILQDWFNAELKHVVRIQPLARGIIHKLLKEGTVYTIPSYCMESKTVREFTLDGDPGVGLYPDQVGNPLPMDAQTKEPFIQSPSGVMLKQGGLPKIVEKQERTFEGVWVNILNFEDVMVDDFADEWEEADVIRKVRFSYGS